jgi:hypothetical protein
VMEIKRAQLPALPGTSLAHQLQHMLAQPHAAAATGAHQWLLTNAAKAGARASMARGASRWAARLSCWCQHVCGCPALASSCCYLLCACWVWLMHGRCGQLDAVGVVQLFQSCDNHIMFSNAAAKHPTAEQLLSALLGLGLAGCPSWSPARWTRPGSSWLR